MPASISCRSPSVCGRVSATGETSARLHRSDPREPGGCGGGRRFNGFRKVPSGRVHSPLVAPLAFDHHLNVRRWGRWTPRLDSR